METIRNPQKRQWAKLSRRPVQNDKNFSSSVAEILAHVKQSGDQALHELTLKFDQIEISHLQISQEEIEHASAHISNELAEAIEVAIANIEKFHKAQLVEEEKIETSHGVFCWRKNVAIEKVGLYIPGGTAPLFSTVLMLGIPAKIAGCSKIVLCSPPDKEGKIHPAILYAANRVGITDIFKVGGAQAIAAMTFGSETIPKVDKIFGPGNQFVTEAKQQAALLGAAIDMPAGPSEVLVIADDSGNAEYIAADLLAQAEHGPDSQVLFVTDSENMISLVKQELQIQIQSLPRKEIAAQALQNSKMILLQTIDEALDFSNQYAPEHLIIMAKNIQDLENKIKNAGSVFLGNYTPESAGDYASGTNHVLPTNSYARNYSGASVDSFLKKITFQRITEEGLQELGPTIEVLAAAEQLIAHQRAVAVRLAKKDN